jgi:hypothetical protein
MSRAQAIRSTSSSSTRNRALIGRPERFAASLDLTRRRPSEISFHGSADGGLIATPHLGWLPLFMWFFKRSAFSHRTTQITRGPFRQVRCATATWTHKVFDLRRRKMQSEGASRLPNRVAILVSRFISKLLICNDKSATWSTICRRENPPLAFEQQSLADLHASPLHKVEARPSARLALRHEWGRGWGASVTERATEELRGT